MIVIGLTKFQKAKSEKVPFYAIHDAGRTQVPEGSLTVASVGPADLEVMGKVTGHLRLL